MRKKLITEAEFKTFKPEIQALLQKGKVLDFLWAQYKVGATNASVTFDGPDFLIEYKGPRFMRTPGEGRYDIGKDDVRLV